MKPCLNLWLRFRRPAALAPLLLLAATSAAAQVREFVRVGAYNIKFFSPQVVDQGDRLQKIRAVIEGLDADVLGLQGIDRHLLFPASQHDILIDNESSEHQQEIRT